MRVLSTVRLQSAATFPHMTAAAIAFHPDGHRWVSLSSGTVYLWDGTNQRYKVPLKHRTQDIGFSPDGNTILAGAAKIDTETGSLNEPLLFDQLVGGIPSQFNARAESFSVTLAAASPAGDQTIVYAQYSPSTLSGSVDVYKGPTQRLLVLDSRTLEVAAILRDDRSYKQIHAVAMSNQHIAAGEIVYDRHSYQEIAALDEFSGSVCELCFSDDGSLLASAGFDGRVVIRETQSWASVLTLPPASQRANALALHPQHPLLALGRADGQVEFVSLTGERLFADSFDSGVEALAFSPGGEQFAAAVGLPNPAIHLFRLDIK